MSEDESPKQYLDPRCSGVNLNGQPCAAPFPMWRYPEHDTLFCSGHKGQAPGPVERWFPDEHGDALDPERRCLGRMRGGDKQCPAVATTSVVIEEEKVRVCSWHKKLFGEYGTLQPPSRTHPVAREVEPLPDEDDVTVNGSSAASTNGAAPTNGEAALSMRERIDRSAQESYEEIEAALRRALKGTTKAKGVKCPNCGDAFKVLLPDHTAAIASAKLLLELVVSRPKPPEEERPLPTYGDGEMPDYGSMTTAELRRLAFPGQEPPPMPSYMDDEDEVAS